MNQQIALPANNSSHLRSNGLALALVAVVGLGAFLIAGWFLTRTYVSTSSVSPDGKLRLEIVDRSLRFIDRNFTVRIVDDRGNSRTVFRSPDEPPTGIGGDRLLWSEDGKRMLLIGDFWAREGSELADDHSPYLLYDVETGEVRCNSDQEGFRPFEREELNGFHLDGG